MADGKHLTLVVLFLLFQLLIVSCQRSDTAPDSDSGKDELRTQKKTSGDNRPVEEAQHGLKFTEIAQQAGIEFTYHNGSEAKEDVILESLGGGVASFDFDRDGWCDLMFSGGGLMENRDLTCLEHGLFRNLGGLKFSSIAEQAFITKGQFYSHGPAVGDFDNDGFEDLLITGYGGIQFFQNQGDGTFFQRELPGLDADSWSSSAGWADLNGDQLLDLYICNYTNWSWENNPVCGSGSRRDICSPRKFEALNDAVYFNNGDGTLTDATESAGLVAGGKGLGVILADIDQDADVDVYVANDTVENFLYINDGQGNLAEKARDTGTALGGNGIPNGSMGVDVCDFNGDLKVDIWVANFESESFALYRNEGNGFFLHVSEITGVTTLGSAFVGFGTAWADFDMDGDQDAVVTNGHVINFSGSAPRRQLPLLLLNDGQRVNRVLFPGNEYFGSAHEGRGLALCDLDNDGDLDIAISSMNDPVALLRNDCKTVGDWLAVQLIGVKSNRFAIGATLILYTDKGNYLRQIKGGGSYMSASDSRVFWGIPRDAKIERLEISWPSGTKQEIPDIHVNETMVLVEPDTTAETP